MPGWDGTLTYEICQRIMIGRCFHRKKLQYQTYLLRIQSSAGRDRDEFSIEHFGNEILRYYHDGPIRVAAWHTCTTKKRLNQYLPSPYRVWSEHGLTLVQTDSQGTTKSLVASLWLDRDAPEGIRNTDVLRGDHRELYKMIDSYVRHYTTALFRGKISRKVPTCCVTKDEDTGHLREHITRQEHTPQLILNCVVSLPHWSTLLGELWGENVIKNFSKEASDAQVEERVQAKLAGVYYPGKLREEAGATEKHQVRCALRYEIRRRLNLQLWGGQSL